MAEYLRAASTEEESIRQRRLATALIDAVPRQPDGSWNWNAAQPYLVSHLATHAAAVGLLDQLLDDPGFLLAANPARLLRALPAVITPAARERASVYRLAVHQLRDRPIEEAAAYLELAARQQHLEDLAEQIAQLRLPQPWSTVWAAWQPTASHYITGRDLSSVRAVALGKLDGRPVAVSGSDDATVRLWDLREGDAIGEPLTGHTQGIRAVAMGELDGRPIVVSGSDDATVWVWDLREGDAIGKPLTGHNDVVDAVALGELDGRSIVVSGSRDDTIRVWDLEQGAPTGQSLGTRLSALDEMAFGELGGRSVAFTGGWSRLLQLWDVRTAAPLGEPIISNAEVTTAVALGELDGRPVAVTGDHLDATVRVWDLREGVAIGEPLTGHTQGVNAVALGELDGRPVIASGGWDQTVRMWDLRTGRGRTAHMGAPISAIIHTLSGILVGTSRGFALLRPMMLD